MDKSFFSSIWNLNIYEVSGSSIKLNQIIIAVFIIITGILFSKKFATIISNRLKRLKYISDSLALFIKKTISNILIFATFLVALPVAGIPITVFTVLGGAAAIGIGFGMQNLFNNLISSLIIMVERPVRIGDIIEVAGEKGSVEDIGSRRVIVRRTDGVDLLIPNSYFLEQTLVNWTLTDKNIRGKVELGVSYGSDIEKVKSILLKIASLNDRVFNIPSTKVLFKDFGDSSLVFKLLFWTKINTPLELEELESELRFHIYKEFKVNNITIAFPQTDIHFNAEKPINIRMVKPQ